MLFDQKIPYEKYLRNRIRISYTDFNKITPFVSGETFAPMINDGY